MPYPRPRISYPLSPLSSRSFDSIDKKQLIFETVRPVSSSEELGREFQQVNDPNWKPGFRARFPWIGFGALFTVLLCAASSCIILYSANGRSETHWPEQIAPNVLLNIMNNIANICFGIAIGNGIAIAWWRKTLKGSSIVDLHRSWAFSTSIKDVVLSLKYFNIVALAALTAKLTLIDGTLMQKALTFYDDVDARSIGVSNIRGFAGQHWGGTGSVVDDKGNPGMMANCMLDTLKTWTQTGGTYPIQWTGCKRGFCYVEVPTLGFAFDCDRQTEQDIDYGNMLERPPNSTAGDSFQLFDVRFEPVLFGSQSNSNPDIDYTPPAITSHSGLDSVRSAGPSSHLKMHIMYSKAGKKGDILDSNSHCPGTKFEQSCRLWPAIVKYPVQIQNLPGARSVSVGAHEPTIEKDLTSNPDLAKYDIDNKQQLGFEVMQYLSLNDTKVSDEGVVLSALSGIQMGLEISLQGEAHLSLAKNRDNGFIIHQKGQAANYLPEPPVNTSTCSYHYVNPMDPYHAPNGLFTIPSVVAKINQIMFGYATDISSDGLSDGVAPEDFPAFEGRRFPYAVHYQANFYYMWGAVAATVTCVSLVLPVYWGFWELGRKVSLNPFEIAHAFRSPVVGHASTAVTEDLMKEVGHHTIRYGPVLSGDGHGRFGVAAPEHVARVPTGLSKYRHSSNRWI